MGSLGGPGASTLGSDRSDPTLTLGSNRSGPTPTRTRTPEAPAGSISREDYARQLAELRSCIQNLEREAREAKDASARAAEEIERLRQMVPPTPNPTPTRDAGAKPPPSDLILDTPRRAAPPRAAAPWEAPLAPPDPRPLEAPAARRLEHIRAAGDALELALLRARDADGAAEDAPSARSTEFSGQDLSARDSLPPSEGLDSGRWAGSLAAASRLVFPDGSDAPMTPPGPAEGEAAAADGDWIDRLREEIADGSSAEDAASEAAPAPAAGGSAAGSPRPRPASGLRASARALLAADAGLARGPVRPVVPLESGSFAQDLAAAEDAPSAAEDAPSAASAPSEAADGGRGADEEDLEAPSPTASDRSGGSDAAAPWKAAASALGPGPRRADEDELDALLGSWAQDDGGGSGGLGAAREAAEEPVGGRAPRAPRG